MNQIKHNLYALHVNVSKDLFFSSGISNIVVVFFVLSCIARCNTCTSRAQRQARKKVMGSVMRRGRGKEVEIKSIFLFSRRVTSSSSSSFVDDFEKVQVSNFFRDAIILHFLLRCNRLNWTRLLLLLVE